MEVDLSETVGWFTTIYPVQTSKRCRYLSPAGRETFKDHSKVEVLLNYAGVYQQLESDESLLCLEGVSCLDLESPRTRRISLVEFNIDVHLGRLMISCTFHRQMKHQVLLHRWMTLFGDALTVAAHQLRAGPRKFTLSDLPLLPNS
ncbi:hypothetical protein BDW74DRAFT_171946 [Aspergillus multicolor]|uniref:uncharacterized protein n=1 Tax=Aspergillus multicolor TaxID=41759 RepID=UPI003CCE310C